MAGLLDYETQMFLDLFHHDGLLLTAKGLGIDRILLAFLRLYSDPANLVLVLNTSQAEEEYFVEELRRTGVEYLPKIVTTEIPGSERKDLYKEGGVLFVTSRILVVDFLTDRVPANLVTGILVYKAHKIMDSCLEAFVLRLYRQKNKQGFIKAFTDQPTAFTTGFCKVERVMRCLFVRKLYLWPRFHATVQACLEQRQVDVVEIAVGLSPAAQAIQSCILEVLGACLRELHRHNPSLDLDSLSLENAIGNAFDKTIRLQLDPVWHTLGAKTRSLVQDLRVLRTLLLCLTQYDAVTFLSLLESLWSSHKAFGQNSGWLFMDAANSMFVHTRARVYGYSVDNDSGKRTDGEKQELLLEKNPKWEALLEVLEEIERENKDSKDLGGPGQVLVCASDDKTCAQLRELLCRGPDSLLQNMFKQSHSGSASGGSSSSANSVRGLDGRFDANDVLDMPKISTEWLQPAGCIKNPSTVFRGQKRPALTGSRSKGQSKGWHKKGKKKKEEKESGLGKGPRDLTLTQMLQHPKNNDSDQEEEDENDEGKELCFQDEDNAAAVEEEQEEEMECDTEEKNREEERHQEQKKEDEVIKPECGDVKGLHEAGRECKLSVEMSERLGLLADSIAVLHPLRGSADPYSLTRLLRELQPRYVILYDADLGPVRQLEVFRASRPGLPLRVYFLMFEGSTEEQRYLTTLRKEKEAFEMLIREKASMVVPIEREGRDDTNLDLSRDMRKAHATVDSWKAGGQVQSEISKVVVDMREFRSELPALLHRRGFQIEPVTLEIGDYMLTPQLCVERKSISDLVSSLNNGRLFSQCTAMSRRYPRPALLIEFDAGQPFSLQDCAGGSAFQEISSHGITSKLALLTLHFPKLRLFWCPSPHAAAELFEELKQNNPEPDPQAMAIMSDEECGFAFPGSRFNTAPYDFLLRMPGVSEKTVRSLARDARTLAGLADMEESRLAEVLGSSVNAQRLWAFLHTPGAKALSGRNQLTGSRGGCGAKKGLGKAGRAGRVRR
uniref:DNA repair endonuclease XPF n=1 Tax=Eptatretus burgeri TaxID=7764 RepID=A0A8C4QG17_EPTBU